jgi:curved DNA-binding protein CbpA
VADTGAPVAAAQLLAFCKDPVRYRPRLTHGREIAPGGLHVFRFAQGRFPHGLFRELPAAERDKLRRAANFYIRQVCFWEGATHYQVLCVPPDSRRELIKEHYHSLIALIHPDRQDADSEHWPPEAAHRVNLAYAVLSDDVRRAEYDAGMRKSAAEGAHREVDPPPSQVTPVHRPIRGRAVVAGMKLRRPALYVAAAIASLFFVEMWWAGQVPEEYATLDSATPLQLSTNWIRSVFPSSDRPRYLATGRGFAAGNAAGGGSAAPEESESLLMPFWRALTGVVAETKPAPDPLARVPARAATGVSVPAALEPAAARKVDSRTAASVPVRLPQPVAPARVVREPEGIAQASAMQAAPDPALRSPDMEALVATLVAHYEAGDLDRLVGLMDAPSVDVLEAVRLRGSFRDFFETTTKRHLHFQRVSWEPAGDAWRMNGQALLRAEHRDETGRFDRTVTVTMDVRMRDGQLRIARLSLFPYE